MCQPEADPGEKQETAGDHAGEVVPKGLEHRLTWDVTEQRKVEGEMEDHHRDQRQRAGNIQRDQAGLWA